MNSMPSLTRSRWLVVDENPNISWMVALILQSLGLPEGEHFSSAREAFQQLRKSGGYDLVIVDQSMSELNGAEFSRWVRAECPEARVVLMTASVEEMPEADLRYSGVDAVLLKPFSLPQFEAAIRGLLAQGEGDWPGLAALPSSQQAA